MGHKIVTAKQVLGLSLIFSLILAASLLPAALMGSASLGISKIFDPTVVDYTIFWDIRVPRILMAAIAGAVLGICGAAYQAMFSNPLAEPYLLGVSSGAALGAVFAMASGLSWFISPLFAFIFAGIAILFVYKMALANSSISTTRLILAGVMLNTLCGALIMLILALSPDKNLQNIIFWLMGDLSNTPYITVMIAVLAGTAGIVFIYNQAMKLNIMALGDEQAIVLGIDTDRVKLIIFISSSLMIAGIVSFVGLIGFVGLIVPHIIRLLSGPDNRLLLPLSGFGGAIFLVICDTLSRTLIAPSELPIGVITALIGAPLFLYLLRGRV